MEAERSALIVVDMLNTYEHEDATRLVESVEKIVAPLSELVETARRDGIEIVYVNDNYGDWNSSQEELAEQALGGARPDLVEPILPPDDAAFVIKARHSIQLKVSVPTDGVAHIEEHLAKAAFEMMQRNMGAELSPCAETEMRGGRDGAGRDKGP